jgi:Flp pilus assembly secretin CpaC
MSARTRLAGQFLSVLKEDFNQFGSRAIASLRRRKPEIYLQLVADLLPKEANINVEAPQGGRADDAPREIELGVNESMTIELPRETREVDVSDPDKIDALMRSSTQSVVIGKEVGEANARFFDRNGVEFATLKVTVRRDPWSHA